MRFFILVYLYIVCELLLSLPIHYSIKSLIFFVSFGFIIWFFTSYLENKKATKKFCQKLDVFYTKHFSPLPNEHEDS